MHTYLNEILCRYMAVFGLKVNRHTCHRAQNLVFDLIYYIMYMVCSSYKIIHTQNYCWDDFYGEIRINFIITSWLHKLLLWSLIGS